LNLAKLLILRTTKSISDRLLDRPAGEWLPDSSAIPANRNVALFGTGRPHARAAVASRLEQAARNIRPVTPQAASAFLLTVPLIQSVLTDLGRTMGEPSARFRISCEHIPMARETPNKTV